jgi:hypothetical protein
MRIRRQRLPSDATKQGQTWCCTDGRRYEHDGESYVCLPPKKIVASSYDGPGKLTEEDASWIKGQLSVNANQTWLAEKFGVRVVTIHQIGKGMIWKKAPVPPNPELEGPPKGVHHWRWPEYLPYDET